MPLSPVPGLAYQLHHWLEEVDVETEEIIDAIESLQSGSGAIAVILLELIDTVYT